MKFKNLVGKKFGRLTVLAYAYYANTKVHWLCECECGNTTIVRGNSLVKKTTTSCGCWGEEIRKKKAIIHGLYYTGAYRSWILMKARCYNPAYPNYNRYGGRGIKICDEWLHSPEVFYQDMGDRPIGTSIERIDNDKGYSKENCKWATRFEQNNNRSTNRRISINGETKTVKEWSLISGIKYRTILGRLNRGVSDYDAIFAQVKDYKDKSIGDIVYG